MNRSESKYFHTAQLMNAALIQLLEKKEFAFITVKEICEKAGVNRSTFYLHYETVGDLLEETLENTMKEFLSRFPMSPETFVPNIPTASLNDLVLIRSEFIRPYLLFVQEHKTVYAAAYKNPNVMKTDRSFMGMSKHILKPILVRFRIPEAMQNYMIQFYVNGCAAIIREWLRKDCRDSVAEMEQVIMSCIRPESGLQSIL